MNGRESIWTDGRLWAALRMVVQHISCSSQMLEAGQGSTFDLYGEHDAIRIRRAQLAEAVASRADIPGAFAAFARSISVHFDNEEELVFPAALGWLTKSRVPA